MPNWCVGKLKVRGSIENLTRFLADGCTPVDADIYGVRKAKLQPDVYGDFEYDGPCYIEGTSGGFLDGVYVYMSEYSDKTLEPVIVLDAKFKWDIDVYELLGPCEKYDVDMRIFAFERGGEFNRNIIIVDKCIEENRTIGFADYDWDCIDPTIGG